MHQYAQTIRAFLLLHRPNYGDGDVHSLLEMLYQVYVEYNPFDTPRIRECFSQLDHLLSPLTLADTDRVFALVCHLCSEHEKLAFLEGIRVGAALSEELHR